MPQANATTALALAVVIAGSFNSFNDEVVPQPTPAVVESGVQVGERALHVPLLKQWEFTEELPGLPQPIDQDYHWSATPLVAAAAPVRYFWGDDEIATAAAAFGVDETYWLAPAPELAQPVVRHFWFNDEITQAPTSSAYDETGWGGQRKLHAPELKLWEVADDLPQAAAPLGIEEAYWPAPVPELVPPVVRHFWFNDEITQAPTSSAYDETGWGGQRKLHAPELKLWEVADDLPQPATPLGVDEAYWPAPVPELVPPVVRHFWFNDEITQAPTSSAYDETGWGGQRKLHVPELKLWEFADDLPQAASVDLVPSQEDAFIVTAIGADPQPMVFAADEDIVPAAAPLAITEPEWQVYTPPWLAARPLYLPDPEQAVPTPPPALAITEPEWQVVTPPWPAAQPLYLPDPEQAFAPQLRIDETEWQVYTPPWPAARPLYLPDPEHALPKSLLVDEMYWAVYTPPLAAKIVRVWFSEDEFGDFIENPVYGWGARGGIGRTSARDPWSRIGSEQAVDPNASIGSDTAVDPNATIGTDKA